MWPRLVLAPLVTAVLLSAAAGAQMSESRPASLTDHELAGPAPALLDEAIEGLRIERSRFEAAIARRPLLADTHDRGVSNETTDDVALAKELQNPIADLISVPFHSNFDFGGGPSGRGFRYQLNLQPVIPISISDRWNLISRTIAPLIDQRNLVGASSQTGLGDTLQSFFFSPKKPVQGVIWGAGPALLLPTATDDVLGTGKLSVGPTAVAVTQPGGWTLALLSYQVWSIAGDGDRADVNRTYLQPVVSYTTKTSTTFSLNTESFYDWTSDQWTVPVNFSVSQVLKIGSQRISLGLGGKYYADGPLGTPEWGIRVSIVLLFPR